MPWRQVGSSRFYYRNRRVNGRVVTQYCGSGLYAKICAQHDRENRRLEAKRRQVEQWLLDGIRAMDDDVAAFADRAMADAAEALTAAGYHRPRRKWWRKRREPA